MPKPSSRNIGGGGVGHTTGNAMAEVPSTKKSRAYKINILSDVLS